MADKLELIPGELREFTPTADPELIAAVINLGKSVDKQTRNMVRMSASDWAVAVLWLVVAFIGYRSYGLVEDLHKDYNNSVTIQNQQNVVLGELTAEYNAVKAKVEELDKTVKSLRNKPVGNEGP